MSPISSSRRNVRNLPRRLIRHLAMQKPSGSRDETTLVKKKKKIVALNTGPFAVSRSVDSMPKRRQVNFESVGKRRNENADALSREIYYIALRFRKLRRTWNRFCFGKKCRYKRNERLELLRRDGDRQPPLEVYVRPSFFFKSASHERFKEQSTLVLRFLLLFFLTLRT